MKTPKQKSHTDRKHSDLSASATSRWMNCPGSVELVKKAPPQKYSPYAAEGTKAHECLERIVKARLAGLGKAPGLNTYPDEMILHCIKAADTIFALRPSKTAKLLIETKAKLTGIGPDMYGTLDYAWVDEWGLLVVIDFKYGAGVAVLPIDEETKEPNSQLMYYALALCQKFNFEFDAVKLAIIQPRVWKEDEDPLTEGTVTIRQMREFQKKLKSAVELALKKGAPLVASEKACRFCPAASMCPEISKNQMQKADIVFDLDTGIEAAPDIKSLTAATLPKVLDACDLLEVWIDRVREHAFQIASNGEKIAGRKLVDKRATRTWVPQAEKKALHLWGDDIYSKEFLSPAQLEKKLGKSAKDFTSQYTTQVSSGLRLAKDTDKGIEKSHTVFDLDEK